MFAATCGRIYCSFELRTYLLGLAPEPVRATCLGALLLVAATSCSKVQCLVCSLICTVADAFRTIVGSLQLYSTYACTDERLLICAVCIMIVSHATAQVMQKARI